jgi:hypothetical protein
VIPLVEFCLGSFPVFLCPIFFRLLLVETFLATFFGVAFGVAFYSEFCLLPCFGCVVVYLGTWSMGFGIASGSVLGRAWISSFCYGFPSHPRFFILIIVIVGFFWGMRDLTYGYLRFIVTWPLCFCVLASGLVLERR